jgi:GH15 family glucan-1,4-alpha-glucosidase
MAPRFDYGLTTPHLELVGKHAATVYGGADSMVLQSSAELHQDEAGACVVSASLRRGQGLWVALDYMRPHLLEVRPMKTRDITARIKETIEFWQTWSSRLQYDGPYRDEVERSALVLKALTNAPTGGIVAAPTTSLPEAIGGERNWDYRYVWVRDATLIVDALFSLGFEDEGAEFMRWLRRTTAGTAEDLQIMYGVGGERLLYEFEVSELRGYRDSAPVRIGNDAWQQHQHDVFGELLDSTWQFVRHGGKVDDVFWRLLCQATDRAIGAWKEPDSGMWEVRDPPRHYVSSKVMCWVALDRAIRLAERLGFDADTERWKRERRRVRRLIESRGVDKSTGAFVRELDGVDADASALLVPLTGFLRGDDPRVRSTIELVERSLSVNGLLRRYTVRDGLEGDEGAFIACTFWLAANHAMAGDPKRAREVFERTLECANDVGLLAEEADPHTGELLGNFPQAFSHLALIGAATRIHEAEAGG